MKTTTSDIKHYSQKLKSRIVWRFCLVLNICMWYSVKVFVAAQYVAGVVKMSCIIENVKGPLIKSPPAVLAEQ